MEPKLEWIEEWARAYVAAHDAKDLHTAEENQSYWLCVFLLRLSKDGSERLKMAREYVDGAIANAAGTATTRERRVLEDLIAILSEGGVM